MISRAKPSNSNTESQDNARKMQQAPNNQQRPVRKTLPTLALKLETHSSRDQPLSSPHTGATLSSTTHAVSPDLSMTGPRTVYRHGSSHNSAYWQQQQPSPHVSPYPDSQAQFLRYAASQQFNQAPFECSQMPYSQHQPTAFTPDITSPNTGQRSSLYGYHQNIHSSNE